MDTLIVCFMLCYIERDDSAVAGSLPRIRRHAAHAHRKLMHGNEALMD